MIRPLIIVPLAGAVAGLIHYYCDHLRVQGLWKKALGLTITTLLTLSGFGWELFWVWSARCGIDLYPFIAKKNLKIEEKVRPEANFQQ